MKCRTGMMLACMIVLLCGCGGLQRSDSIGVVGLFSGLPVELSVQNRQYPAPWTDAMTYVLDRPWKETEFCRQAEPYGEVQVMRDGYVLFANAKENQCDAFYFPFSQYEHIATNMSVKLISDPAQMDREQNIADPVIQIPLYLFSDKRMTTEVQPEIYAGIEYEVSSKDMDAFLCFYQRTGWYRVEKSDEDTLIISGYQIVPTRTLLEDKTFDVPFPLKLHMTEHYTIPYVSITTS